VRLPVLKILWGIFAFPAMYPAQTLRAAGPPLIGVIATTLYWARHGAADVLSLSSWLLVFVNWVLFAWLAVRIHRVVLLGRHEDDLAHRLGCMANYLAAVVLGELVFSVFLALISFRYVPTAGGAPSVDGMVGLPAWATWLLQLAPLYLLARVSPALPGFALGHGWRLGEAWHLSKGNGWRLVAVIYLVPWAFGALVDLVYASSRSGMLAGLLAVLHCLFTALALMALSLSYHELTAGRAPPPTAPPA
jgi:hypothetical protein